MNSGNGAPDGFGELDVCVRCSAQGPTCCRISPGEEEHCFPLSDAERNRILDCAGDKGAFVQTANHRPFIDNMKRLFSGEREGVERLFPEHRTHFRLATDAAGACVFLGGRGCVLPREARPYYCRLFPFWIHGGRLTLFTPDYCLALREARTPGGMLALMDMSQGMVRELHGRLRLAWGLQPGLGMETAQRTCVGQRK